MDESNIFTTAMNQVINILKPSFSFFVKYYLPILFCFCVYKSFTKVEYPDRTRLVLYSDAEGYYLYLPAIFIHHSFEDLPVRSEKVFQPHESSNRIFTKFTCGVALLELPFFLVAHWLAPSLGYAPDGYSEIYVRAILLAAICYGFLGLFFLKKRLEQTFPPWVMMLSIVAILLGTNLFHYMIDAGGMSHAYSFFLFAVFIYLTPKILQRPSIGLVFLFGFIFGWIVLIRPTNAVLVLYPIFYNIFSKKDFKNRIQFIQEHFYKIVFLLLGMLLIFLPQFMYWHHVTGEYVMYSYGDESFIYWKNPQVLNLWFSPRNGWLIYNPMLIASIVGLFFGLKKNRNNHALILGIFVLITYILSSWWCWWFGGAFGQRSYVEYYTLLIFPIAWMLDYSFYKKRKLFIVLLIFLAWGIDYGLKMNRYHRDSYITSEPDYDWKRFEKVRKRLY